MKQWRGTVRTISSIEFSAGKAFGSAVLCRRLCAADNAMLGDVLVLEDSLFRSSICRVRLWRSDRSAETKSVGAAIRPEEDETVGAVLIAELTRECDLVPAEALIRKSAVGQYLEQVPCGSYRLICGMQHASQ